MTDPDPKVELADLRGVVLWAVMSLDGIAAELSQPGCDLGPILLKLGTVATKLEEQLPGEPQGI